jgi:hypothetical protein
MAILEGGYAEGETIVAILKDPKDPTAGLSFYKKGEAPPTGAATAPATATAATATMPAPAAPTAEPPPTRESGESDESGAGI